jgi:hypothetical protein
MEQEMKLVVNKCYGGFSLSREQALAYGFSEEDLVESFDGKLMYHDLSDIDRTDARLIEVVEMGLPSAWASNLQVVEIPDGVNYKIHEYDGNEYVIWSESEIHYA